MIPAEESGKRSEVIARDMIEHLALLSKAMDEYFEIPSVTVIDSDPGSVHDRTAESVTGGFDRPPRGQV
jgi:hypothetical protein